ncbi:MAG: YitT family protein [Clostridia bacterium]|nr:YitT family protein [Clostridia bacterium]
MKFKITYVDFLKASSIFVGALVYAFGMNCFVVPTGLYTSGLLGFSQIIRTVLEEFFALSFPFDISGIISFGLNIPLLIFAYKAVGKTFIFKTLFCIVVQTVLLSVLPINTIIDDPLTSCIVGGIMCGFGVGVSLRNGGSTGGVDVIGMYFAKKSSYSVGTVSMIFNIFVYGCAFLIMHDLERIIYTLIYASISTIALDRMHIQNINSEVIIISKQKNAEIQEAIIREMHRGVSYWEGYGAYTGESNHVLYVVVSKYEVSQLKKIVKKIDPNSFVSIKNGIDITGNFQKRL